METCPSRNLKFRLRVDIEMTQGSERFTSEKDRYRYVPAIYIFFFVLFPLGALCVFSRTALQTNWIIIHGTVRFRACASPARVITMKVRRLKYRMGNLLEL